MKLEQLNEWLTLAANVGVIAGIVFLAIEIQQNTESIEQNTRIARANAAKDFTDFFSRFRAHSIGDEGAARIFLAGRIGAELTETERFRFGEMAFDLLHPASAAYRQALAVEDREMATEITRVVARYISCPGLRRIWDNAQFSPDFKDAVEAIPDPAGPICQ